MAATARRRDENYARRGYVGVSHDRQRGKMETFQNQRPRSIAQILVPSLAVMLRIKRLRLFVTLVVKRVWQILAIVATGNGARNSWLSTITDDLAWAAQRTVALESMIGASLATWVQKIDDMPKSIFPHT